MKRTAVVITLTVAILMSLFMGNASASPSAASSIVPASYSLTPKVSYHWWGYTIVWNKDATNLIAAGAVPAAGVLGNLTGGPLAGMIAAGVTGVAQQIAEQAVEHGNCLEFVNPWGSPGWLWRAHC